jgi:hypothetical protein
MPRRLSVGLDTCQLQDLICDYWLLERFTSVVLVDFPITHWRTCRVDVAVRPVSSTLVGVEKFGLVSKVFLVGKSRWCHTNVLYVANQITFWKQGPMHGPAVPENLFRVSTAS